MKKTDKAKAPETKTPEGGNWSQRNFVVDPPKQGKPGARVPIPEEHPERPEVVPDPAMFEAPKTKK